MRCLRVHELRLRHLVPTLHLLLDPLDALLQLLRRERLRELQVAARLLEVAREAALQLFLQLLQPLDHLDEHAAQRALVDTRAR